MRTFIIDGKTYRQAELEAADSRANREHICAQPPIGYTTAKEIREGTRARSSGCGR